MREAVHVQNLYKSKNERVGSMSQIAIYLVIFCLFRKIKISGFQNFVGHCFFVGPRHSAYGTYRYYPLTELTLSYYRANSAKSVREGSVHLCVS